MVRKHVIDVQENFSYSVKKIFLSILNSRLLFCIAMCSRFTHISISHAIQYQLLRGFIRIKFTLNFSTFFKVFFSLKHFENIIITIFS